MRREQAIFNLEIKKKSGLSINPDIHHSKVFSSGNTEIKFHFIIKNVRFTSLVSILQLFPRIFVIFFLNLLKIVKLINSSS